MSILFLLGLLIQGLGTSFFADDSTNYVVRNYTVEDGLPVNAVNGIVQDDNGYLYFSTLDGLVRYDGYNFVTFNSSNSPGLTNNRLAQIFQSKSGIIWLAGEGGEIIKYQQQRFQTYHPAEGTAGREFILGDDPSGKLWIGTNSGIAAFRDSLDQFVFLNDSLLTAPSTAIKPTGDDEGWVVNRHGLIRWHGNSTEVRLRSSELPISTQQINQMTVDSHGYLWLLGNHGIVCIQSTAGQTSILFRENMEDLYGLQIVEKKDGTFLLSTLNGFYTIDFANKTLQKLPVTIEMLPTLSPQILQGASGELILIGDNEVVIDGEVVFESEEIQTGFVDLEGSIWIVSRTQGVFQIRKSIIRNITSTDEYPISNVYPIIQTADSTIWAASQRGGIFQFRDSEVISMNETEGPATMGFTQSLYEDTDGTVYAGLGGRGLWAYSEAGRMWEEIQISNSPVEYPQSIIHAMHRDRSGRLVLGMFGLARAITQDTVQVLKDADGQTLTGVRVIREDENGTLYLGTSGNGLALLPPGGRFQMIGEAEGLASNYLRDIYLQSQDTLLVATENKGLNRILFSPDKKITSISQITSEDGLTDNSLHRIIRGALGHFWISSNGGIMRISKTGLHAYADGRSNSLPLISLNERDGMLHREANGGVQSAGILTSDNKLWFPNQTGITVIDPLANSLRTELPAQTPVIEQITMRDSLITLKDQHNIYIPKGRRNLNFTFTAPNFANPERILFKYRLSEVNQDWQYTDQALQASYTNLDPGTYRFEVAAGRVNGRQDVSSVAITVPPFFYETAWFYGLMALVAIGLVVAGYRYRVGALERRKATLQKLVNRQTRELQKAAEQKSRFFTGITHELKTPLSLILNPLDEMIESNRKIPQDKNRYYLKMMQRNGYRLQNLVDQILDVSKLNAEAIRLTLQPVDLEAFTIQIAAQFKSMLDDKNIVFDIQKADIKEPVFVDDGAWERVVINLMSNAIKYSPEDSKIKLFFMNKEENVQVHLCDFGAGIGAKDQERVFEYLYQSERKKASSGTGIGLFLVKELTERMGGHVQLYSEVGEGSEFVITLKKGYSHFHDEDTVSYETIEIDKTSVEKQNRVAVETTDKEDSPKHDEHLLIVEDSIDFRNYLYSILSDIYRVTVAGNGVEALQKLETIRPDLVITDLMMPEMNGLEFVEKVRTDHKFKHLPVIFLSAKDTDPDMEAALSTGADIYLTKPIRSRILKTQITAVLRRERILAHDLDQTGISDEPKLIRNVRQVIFRQLGNENLTIDLLADALYLSSSKLYRKWKKVSDLTLNEFIIKVRMDEARVLITEKEFSVQEAAQAVGYSNPNYFSTSFKKIFGELPSEIS